jgi:hypothetical protein
MDFGYWLNNDRETSMIRSLALLFLFIGSLALTGCEEGPFGNNAPQGRPDWMKDRKPANAPPENSP